MDRVTRDPLAQAPDGPHVHADVKAAGDTIQSWGHDTEPVRLPSLAAPYITTVVSTPRFSEGCHNGLPDMIMNLRMAHCCSSRGRAACGEQKILGAVTCKQS